MREILFRGYSENEGCWLFGDYAPATSISPDNIFPQLQYGYIEGVAVTPETVGQYTCLTDKNGTKIFENDIISAHLDDLFPENETRLVVVWHDYGFFGINPRYIDYTQYQTDLITMITSKQSEMKDVLFDSLENEFVKKFEVIGNIYDNPELLK